MPILRNTRASLDEKYAAPQIFTGEQMSVKHIHDGTMTCLPPAEREIECEREREISQSGPGKIYFGESNSLTPGTGFRTE
ncbi:hypothetical protein TNIN_333991 [Trichonephila inaurata madagascariensis]|uniref:Uncharacterized protein n=1 Tax=Trichonephila inaurata madagascariensis TaxID=2747483 RepID=A0A8X7CH05_9ARAC|nr:hypothetical protein TNIN_333991 [Trichonephila inaurata madagascariensis]